jgi:DNA-binding NarL/FixJ family response regulator
MLLQTDRGQLEVDEAADAADTLRRARRLTPDVILLDRTIPPVGGMVVLHELASTDASAHVIVVADAIDRAEIQTALRLGARGVVLKESCTQLLVRAVHGVLAGQYWFPHACLADAVQALRNVLSLADFGPQKTGTPGFGLTRREIEIVSAVAAGCVNKEIAQRLSISENTVKHHLTNIFEKLGLSNRLELAVFALKHHLDTADFSPPLLPGPPRT